MPTTLSEQDLRKLARLGAMARLKELDDEARAIRRMFPGLRESSDAPEKEKESVPAGSAKPRKRKNHMSKEARKAQSERMTAYWAARREAKAAAGADQTPSPKGTRRPRRKAR